MKRIITSFSFLFISSFAFALGQGEATVSDAEQYTKATITSVSADHQFPPLDPEYFSGNLTLFWTKSPDKFHFDNTIHYAGSSYYSEYFYPNDTLYFYRYKITIYNRLDIPVLNLQAGGSDWGEGDIRNNDTSVNIPSLPSGSYRVIINATYANDVRKGRGVSMDDDFISSSDIRIIRIDATPPEPPNPPPDETYIVLSPEDNPSPVVIQKPNGKILTNNASYITFRWSPSVDREGEAASGVKCYKLYKIDGTTQTLLSANVNESYASGLDLVNAVENLDDFFHEGLNTLGLSAVDNLENESDIATFSFYIDPYPPEMVQNLTAGLSTETDDQGFIQSQNVNLNWEPVEFDNPHDNADSVNSGVAGYERCFMPSAVFHGNHDDLRSCDGLTNIEKIDGQTTDAHSISLTPENFPEADRGQNYTFFIRSIDGVGNKSEWTPASNELFIPKGPLGINNVIYDSNPQVKNGQPEYPYTVVFNENPVDYFFTDNTHENYSINGITLLTPESPATGIYYPVETIIDKSGKLLDDWTTSPEGNLAINLKLRGAVYAHKTYTYSTCTTYLGGNAKEYGASKTAVPVPNVKPEFTVIIKDDTGTRELGKVNAEGCVPDTGTPLRLYTNNDVRLYLSTDYADNADGEGDGLKFRLILKDDNSQIGIPGDTAVSADGGYVQFHSELSRVFQVYVTVEESTSNTGANDTPLSDIYPGYVPAYTLHDNGTEGFYINYDKENGPVS